MDHRAEKINILLLDNRFIDWVLNPQSLYNQYWLEWISTAKENAEIAEDAKQLLLELRMAEDDGRKEVDEAVVMQMWEQIAQEMGGETRASNSRLFGLKQYGLAVAVTAGLILLSVIMFMSRPLLQRVAPIATVNQENSSFEIIRYNGSQKNELVFLPDGSKITLAKGARIVYNRLMNGEKRKVQLTGEAFFDVAPNPKKPFYIYTPDMIVKVLGTSFKVTASPGNEAVAVKTGKVSVYLKGQDLEESAPTILLPQQSCTYSTSKKELVTASFASTTKIELETDQLPYYYFEDVPVDSVFKKLETMYSLPIHYNPQIFKDCYITTSLGSESLEEKLEVITKTLGASFSISDYGINIGGEGCK